MTKDKKLEHCREWIKRLKSQYDTLEVDRETALKFVNGDPSIVALVKGRSEIVTTDISDAIETAKPDILETITGTDEPLKLDPTGAEDVEPVKRLQILGNIMIRRKNPWFKRCHDFLDDSMKLKFGVFKYQWVTNNKVIKKDYEAVTDVELASLMDNTSASLLADAMDPMTGLHNVTIAYTTDDEYVKIDTVPAERIKFPLDTGSFDNPAFVVEEVLLYRHEFIGTYGRKAFDKIEEEAEALKSNEDTELIGRYADVGGIKFLYDKENDKYKAYECYFPEEDKDNTPWIFVFAGDTVIIDEENKYGKPPYRGGSPFLLAHRLLGNGYFDLLRETQKQRTFFKRQIFDNVSQANFRRYFANVDATGINLEDYLNNNATNALIRFTGMMTPDTFRPEEKAPLPSEVLEFWEMMNVEKDYHSPTPRSFQGVNPQVLNKTYRGQAQQVNQAGKRLLMMIRGYMEDVFGLLFTDVIDCILKFMKKSTAVRYLNEDITITPDNIIGRYDLIVNVGLGTNDKNDVIVKLQQLIGLMFQSLQLQTGVITSQNIHYVFQELVKAMGFLNTTDFVTDPSVKSQVMEFVQKIMDFMTQISQIPELQQSIAPVMPQLTQMAQQIMASFGVQPQEGKPQQGGPNAQGTFNGQEPAAIPEQPMNMQNPDMNISGGGFWA